LMYKELGKNELNNSWLAFDTFGQGASKAK
jgi:hypothetical protein